MTTVVLDRDKTLLLQKDFRELFGNRQGDGLDAMLTKYRSIIAGSWPLQYFFPNARETWNADLDVWVFPEHVGNFMAFFYEHGYQPFVKIQITQTEDPNADNYRRLDRWVNQVYASAKPNAPNVQLIVVKHPPIQFVLDGIRHTINTDFILSDSLEINQHLLVEKINTYANAQVHKGEIYLSGNVPRDGAAGKFYSFEETKNPTGDLDDDPDIRWVKLNFYVEKFLNITSKSVVESFDLEICQIFYDGKNISAVDNCDLRLEGKMLHGEAEDYLGEMATYGIKMHEREIVSGLEKVPQFINDMHIQGQLKTKKTRISYSARKLQTIVEWSRTLRRIKKYLSRGFDVHVPGHFQYINFNHENGELVTDFGNVWNRLITEVNQIKPTLPHFPLAYVDSAGNIKINSDNSAVYNKLLYQKIENSLDFEAVEKPDADGLAVRDKHIAIFLPRVQEPLMVPIELLENVIKKQRTYVLTSLRKHRTIEFPNDYLNIIKGPLLEKLYQFQHKFQKIQKHCGKFNLHDHDEFICMEPKIPDKKLISEAMDIGRGLLSEIKTQFDDTSANRQHTITSLDNLNRHYSAVTSGDPHGRLDDEKHPEEKFLTLSPELDKNFVKLFFEMNQEWTRIITSFRKYLVTKDLKDLPYQDFAANFPDEADDVDDDFYRHVKSVVENIGANMEDMVINEDAGRQLTAINRAIISIHRLDGSSKQLEEIISEATLPDFWQSWLQRLYVMHENCILLVNFRPKYPLKPLAINELFQEFVVSAINMWEGDLKLKNVKKPSLELLEEAMNSKNSDKSWWQKAVVALRYLFMITIIIQDHDTDTMLDLAVDQEPDMRFRNYWLSPDGSLRNTKYQFPDFALSLKHIHNIVFCYYQFQANKFLFIEDVLVDENTHTNIYSKEQKSINEYRISVINNDNFTEFLEGSPVRRYGDREDREDEAPPSEDEREISGVSPDLPRVSRQLAFDGSPDARENPIQSPRPARRQLNMDDAEDDVKDSSPPRRGQRRLDFGSPDPHGRQGDSHGRQGDPHGRQDDSPLPERKNREEKLPDELVSSMVFPDPVDENAIEAAAEIAATFARNRNMAYPDILRSIITEVRFNWFDSYRDEISRNRLDLEWDELSVDGRRQLFLDIVQEIFVNVINQYMPRELVRVRDPPEFQDFDFEFYIQNQDYKAILASVANDAQIFARSKELNDVEMGNEQIRDFIAYKIKNSWVRDWEPFELGILQEEVVQDIYALTIAKMVMEDVDTTVELEDDIFTGIPRTGGFGAALARRD